MKDYIGFDDSQIATPPEYGKKKEEKSIEKGGHGSGNFHHGPDPLHGPGHPGGSGHGGGRVEAMLKAAKEGGFTYEYYGMKSVTHGLSVGAFPEHSGVFDVMTMKKSDVETWLKQNKRLLTDKRVKVGGWFDKDTNQIWLDAVRVYPQEQRGIAIRMGRKKNQKYIADLDAIARGDMEHAFIDTGGTGEAPKK